MPGISFYPNTEDDNQRNAQNLEGGIEESDEMDKADDKIEVEFDIDDRPTSSFQQSPSRRTTDLVRLYLQEIGRVRLLGREEEIGEAQKVQRYMQLKEERVRAATDENPEIQQYVKLVNARDRLTSQLGHRPSLEK
jgi:RNA polymerase nonessential primary-like sigma factor